MPAPQGWSQDGQPGARVHPCLYVSLCVHTRVPAHKTQVSVPVSTRVYTCACANGASLCACTCVWVRAHARWSSGVWSSAVPGGPPRGEAPTLRAMPSSESLLQRALRGLASSSASLGSSSSGPRRPLSDRRSVPTSRRPSRCSAEPSRGRIWTGVEGHGCVLGGAVAAPPRCCPRGHLGGDEVGEPPQQPSVAGEVHRVAVLHPGLQQAQAAPVDLGEGRAGVLVGPGDRWPRHGMLVGCGGSSAFKGDLGAYPTRGVRREAAAVKPQGLGLGACPGAPATPAASTRTPGVPAQGAADAVEQEVQEVLGRAEVAEGVQELLHVALQEGVAAQRGPSDRPRPTRTSSGRGALLSPHLR